MISTKLKKHLTTSKNLTINQAGNCKLRKKSTLKSFTSMTSKSDLRLIHLQLCLGNSRWTLHLNSWSYWCQIWRTLSLNSNTSKFSNSSNLCRYLWRRWSVTTCSSVTTISRSCNLSPAWGCLEISLSHLAIWVMLLKV